MRVDFLRVDFFENKNNVLNAKNTIGESLDPVEVSGHNSQRVVNS